MHGMQSPPAPPPVIPEATETAPSAEREAALMAAFARGEPGAAAELARSVGARVFAHVARLLQDRAEAEDVTQEAMVRLWQIAPRWEPGRARPSTWAIGVASNLAVDRLRRRRRTAPLDTAPEPPDAAPGQEARMQEEARAAALHAALAALPPRQAQAVSLRHLEGLSNPEIAAIMDIRVEAVESLTARGKRALARDLAGRQAELGLSNDG
jgi:RNA polymerase sigma-70 factor (ECF subfamily)